MGLDMYAWSIETKSVKILKDINTEFEDGSPPEELFYWRKHHDLHGWMLKLYRERGGTGEFNCVNIRLHEEDLDKLEKDVINKKLPLTDEDVKDLLFIAKARQAISEGKAVFYDSWW